MKSKIYKLLIDIANTLEGIDSETNEYRIRAYRTAALTIKGLTNLKLTSLLKNKALETIGTIGKSIASKIYDFIDKGYSPYLDDLKFKSEKLAKHPESLKRFQFVTRDDVEKVKKILSKLKIYNYQIAGGYRRGKNLMKDIDIVTMEPLEKLKAKLQDSKLTFYVFMSGPRILRVYLLLDNKTIPLDIYHTDKDSYGAMLIYTTGDRGFTLALRSYAKQKGYKLNQYGLYKGSKRITTRSEQDIFNELGIPYIHPKNRLGLSKVNYNMNENLHKTITEFLMSKDVSIKDREFRNRLINIIEPDNNTVEVSIFKLGTNTEPVSPKISTKVSKEVTDFRSQLQQLGSELEGYEDPGAVFKFINKIVRLFINMLRKIGDGNVKLGVFRLLLSAGLITVSYHGLKGMYGQLKGGDIDFKKLQHVALKPGISKNKIADALVGFVSAGTAIAGLTYLAGAITRILGKTIFRFIGGADPSPVDVSGPAMKSLLKGAKSTIPPAELGQETKII